MRVHHAATRFAHANLALSVLLSVACSDAEPQNSSSNPTVPSSQAPAGAVRSAPYEERFSRASALSAIPLTGSGGGSSNTNGAAGESGSSGASGGSSGTGGSPQPPLPPPTSKFCGDSIPGPDEECDDGPGDDDDLCSSSCQLVDNLAVAPSPGAVSRQLGRARHPIATGASGFAIAFAEPSATMRSVGVALFDQFGKRDDVVRLGSAVSFVEPANPGVAALPDGSFAVAWTDLNADGDGLGVALQKVSAGGAPSPRSHANQTTSFAQHDADVIWTGNELVVAWVDDSNPMTAPDLKYRRFNEKLAPLGGEEIVAQSSALESAVALTAFNGSWAAAWRRMELDGTAEIGVRTASLEWTIGPIAPSSAGDVPALVELDESHLLVLFTEGTDPLNTGTANVARLRGAIVYTGTLESPEIFEINPLQPPNAERPSIAQTQPSVVRVGEQVFVAWRSSALGTGDKGEELWLKPIVWLGAADGLHLAQPEELIQRGAFNGAGDQRSPALAASALSPQGALVVAWDDYGANLRPGQGNTDVALQLRPTPGMRVPDLEEPSATPLGYRFCNAYAQQTEPPFTVGLSPVPDGSRANPYRICNVEQLAHVASLPTSYFRLMEDLDLSGLTEPISTGTFYGTFDGSGRTLANLKLNRTGPDTGLFSNVEGDATEDGHRDGVIKNLVLRNFRVEGTGAVGAAAGKIGFGGARNVHVLGGLMHTLAATGTPSCGGLAGSAQGLILNSSSSAKVLSADNSISVRVPIGGLVGAALGVSDSFATGEVFADGKGFPNSITAPVAGGLIGSLDGPLARSWASGVVAGYSSSGGLVGEALAAGVVSQCSAHGAVSGSLYAGGLVGTCDHCTIVDSSAHGLVQGGQHSGGLAGAAGRTNSSILRSFATGSVRGGRHVGGLIGDVRNSLRVADCFATGNVSATMYFAGGLLGQLNGAEITVENCYAVGKVEAPENAAALVGEARDFGAFSGVFWSKDIAGALPPISDRTDPAGIFGVTDAELKKAATFSDQGWDLSAVWQISENKSFPVLRAREAEPLTRAVLLEPNESLGTTYYTATFGQAGTGDDTLTGTGFQNYLGGGTAIGNNLRFFDGAGTQKNGVYDIALKDACCTDKITHHFPNKVPGAGSNQFGGTVFDGTALWLGHSRFISGMAPPIDTESPDTPGVRWDNNPGFADRSAAARADDQHLIEIPVLQNQQTRKSFVVTAQMYVPTHPERAGRRMGKVRLQPYVERGGVPLFRLNSGSPAIRFVQLASAGLAWLDRWNFVEMRVDVLTNGGASASPSDDTGQVSYQWFVNGNPWGTKNAVVFTPANMNNTGAVRFGPAFELFVAWYDEAPEAFADNITVSEIISVAP